jgi:hypothetical protein
MNSAAQALLAETTSSPTRVAGAAADGHRVLIRATRPVLDQLASDLSGTAIGVVLTDARGHLVVRRASGPWSRVPTVRPDGASAVAPITDPSSGRAVGNLVLSFRAADANRLTAPRRPRGPGRPRDRAAPGRRERVRRTAGPRPVPQGAAGRQGSVRPRHRATAHPQCRGRSAHRSRRRARLAPGRRRPARRTRG